MKRSSRLSVIGFLAVLALLVLAIVFLLGLSLGTGSTRASGFLSSSISDWITALATASIAVLTMFLAKETWALRKLQLLEIESIRKSGIRPSVAVALSPSRASFQFMNVEVRNNGKGPAQNIKFSFLNLNDEAEDIFEEIRSAFLNMTIFSDGIRSLGEAESRKSFLFSFIDLNKTHKESTFDFAARLDYEYEDIEGSPYKGHLILDFAEYNGTSEIGHSDSLYETAETLKKIDQRIGRFESGFKRLRVDMFDTEDRDAEARSRQEQRAAFKAMRDGGSKD